MNRASRYERINRPVVSRPLPGRSRSGRLSQRAPSMQEISRCCCPEVHVLSEELARAESSDPQFAADLRAVWGYVSTRQRADNGGVVNGITGTVGGNVLQARDIGGGVSF